MIRDLQHQSIEQGLEAGLFKVVIAGQGVCEAEFFHHDKRDAVGERPLFVGSSVIEVAAAFKQLEVRTVVMSVRKGASVRGE